MSSMRDRGGMIGGHVARPRHRLLGSAKEGQGQARESEIAKGRSVERPLHDARVMARGIGRWPS